LHSANQANNPKNYRPNRRWRFTLNNYEGLITQEDFDEWGAKFLIFQEEVGAEGTPHLQGYIEMPRPVRFSHFKLPEATFLVAEASTDANIEYCSKEDTRVGGPYRFGVPSKQGQRTDLIELRNAIIAGKRGAALFLDDLVCGAAIKYQRGVDAMVSAFHKPVERGDIRVVFHYGPAGTGKTTCAHDPEAFYFDGNQGGFWTGYQGQKTIILDEFSGATLKPLQLQRLCDKFPLWSNIKGGQIPCEATSVHICSNYLPDSWWGEKTRYHKEAIYRRIHVVHWHQKRGEFNVYETDEDDEKPENWAMTKFLHDYHIVHPFYVRPNRITAYD